MHDKLQLFLFCSVLVGAVSYPIFQFIINEPSRGVVLLEYSRTSNPALYKDVVERSHPITVIILTSKPETDFKILKEVEKLSSREIQFIYDAREYWKLSTPQVHVVITQTNSPTISGTVKFMIPLRKMNSTAIANFIQAARMAEKYIISPNVDKILCSPNQQVILLNTALGRFKSFTMYVAGINGAGNSTKISDTDANVIDMNPVLAKEILNPIPCDLVIGTDINNIGDDFKKN